MRDTSFGPVFIIAAILACCLRRSHERGGRCRSQSKSGRHRRHRWCQNQWKRAHPGSQRTRGWVDVDLKKGHPSSQSHARGWACCYLLSTVRTRIIIRKTLTLPSSLTTMGVMVVEEEKKCVNKTHAIPKMDIFRLKFVFTAILQSTTAIIDV